MKTIQQTEKRPDRRRQTDDRAAHTNSQEKEIAMNQSTTQWHPEWCSQIEDDINGAEAFHYSHAEVLEREAGKYCTPDRGEGFRLELKRHLNYETGPEYFDEWDVTAYLGIQVDGIDEELKVFLGPNRLREIADFLWTEAYRLDAWYEQQRAKVEEAGR